MLLANLRNERKIFSHTKSKKIGEEIVWNMYGRLLAAALFVRWFRF